MLILLLAGILGGVAAHWMTHGGSSRIPITPAPGPPPLALAWDAAGISQAIQFHGRETITWTYPPCTAPAHLRCVSLIAPGRDDFPMGRTDFAGGREHGSYQFTHDMVGQFRREGDADVDARVTAAPP